MDKCPFVDVVVSFLLRQVDHPLYHHTIDALAHELGTRDPVEILGTVQYAVLIEIMDGAAYSVVLCVSQSPRGRYMLWDTMNVGPQIFKRLKAAEIAARNQARVVDEGARITTWRKE